jgi:hypothetical protein
MVGKFVNNLIDSTAYQKTLCSFMRGYRLDIITEYKHEAIIF